MSVNRLRNLYTDIYKTINELNSSYIKDIFQLNSTDRSVGFQKFNNLKVWKKEY